MAVNHIEFNRQTPHGAGLAAALADFERGWAGLQAHLATMNTMEDAGVSTSYIVGKYGFPSTAVAESAVAELDSALAKLSGDASVSNVNAALRQMLNKFRSG